MTNHRRSHRFPHCRRRPYILRYDDATLQRSMPANEMTQQGRHNVSHNLGWPLLPPLLLLLFHSHHFLFVLGWTVKIIRIEKRYEKENATMTERHERSFFWLTNKSGDHVGARLRPFPFICFQVSHKTLAHSQRLFHSFFSSRLSLPEDG